MTTLRTLLAAAAIAVVAVPAAQAQVAAALGKPLDAPDLDAGTVSVRIIAGAPSNPVVGTDVTLMVNGAPRKARTDAAGRAFFKDLPAGATVKATVLDDEQKEVASVEFQLGQTGERVLLTTKPFEPGAGGAPFAGGAGGMPEPRQMSGEPRAEQSDAPGTVTVRLTYDDFKAQAPAGVTVALVGYHADDSLDVRIVPTDADGRAQFTGLDEKGETSYFALAQLPRNGAIDRMTSIPATLDARVGVRLVLSADKRDSTAAPVDDITRLEKQDHAPADGKLRVVLEGVPETGAKVRVLALSPTGRRTLGELPVQRADADPADVQGRTQFQLAQAMSTPDNPIDPKILAPHALHVQVHGGPGGGSEPIGGVKIRVISAKAKAGTPEYDAAPTVETIATGTIDTTAPDGPDIAEITINGKVLRSPPFDVSTGGGVLDVAAAWEAVGKLYAEVDTAGVKPDEVVIAEATMRGQLYRSIPFQPAAGRGTSVTLYIYPRVMFSFSLTSHIDDEFLAVQGRFDITNNAWAPYIGGADGLVIPLPAHFRGAVIAEQDQGDVAVAQGQGFRIGRPVPPGGKQFHAGFSLPVERGTVEWSMDLPLGTFQSGLEILQTPGMAVQTPKSVTGQVMPGPQGSFYVLPSISILPKQSMQMTISNLPQPPAWRVWLPRIVASFAIVTMLLGLGLALARSRGARIHNAERVARRSALLDELVELERTGSSSDARRAEITRELEALWDD